MQPLPLDQSNELWRFNRIRFLYTEGYGITWIRQNSPGSTDSDIARALQLPGRYVGPVLPLNIWMNGVNNGQT